MKIAKKIGWLLLFVFVVAQFFGPEKNEGDISSITSFIEETNPPENVHIILKETCFDCHSNVTRYPWYSNITPINYWMADHVRVGKGDLNFSEWKSYSLRKKAHKMKEIYEEVEQDKMPLDSYRWTHSEANLSEDEVKLVVDWAKKQQAKYEKLKQTN